MGDDESRPRRHGDAPREPKPRQLEDGDGARRAGDGGTYLLISLPRDTEDFFPSREEGT